MLLKIEKRYIKSLESQHFRLSEVYKEMKDKVTLSLETKEITKAILLRLKAYYQTQNKIKEFLNKRYLPAASDFFVEAVIFYLKLLMDTQNINLEVHSEKQIKQKRRSLRPDISIWKDNKVVAAIECKTQLGWNRHEWESDFKKRELKLKQDFPKAKLFLLVMTSVNWSGFPKTNKNVGKQYFTLSNKWPIEINENNMKEVIINPVEGLFKQIIKFV